MQVRKGTEEEKVRHENLANVDKLIGSSVPYIMHPVAVGMLLLEHQESDNVIIAGILHDILEDTDVTKEVLQQTFGTEVLRLVTAASEPDKSLSWRARKEHTIDYLAACDDMDVKCIAAADKLHNVQSIQLDLEKLGESVWGRFNAS